MKKIFALVTVLSLTLVFFTTTAFINPPVAHASAMKPVNCVLQVKDAGITESGPVAYVQGTDFSSINTSTLSLSQTVSVANTLSGTLGFNVQFISATLGFSVTATTSTTTTASMTLNPLQSGRIDAYAIYHTFLLINSCTGEKAAADQFLNAFSYLAYNI